MVGQVRRPTGIHLEDKGVTFENGIHRHLGIIEDTHGNIPDCCTILGVKFTDAKRAIEDGDIINGTVEIPAGVQRISPKLCNSLKGLVRVRRGIGDPCKIREIHAITEVECRLGWLHHQGHIGPVIVREARKTRVGCRAPVVGNGIIVPVVTDSKTAINGIDRQTGHGGSRAAQHQTGSKRLSSVCLDPSAHGHCVGGQLERREGNAATRAVKADSVVASFETCICRGTGPNSSGMRT